MLVYWTMRLKTFFHRSNIPRAQVLRLLSAMLLALCVPAAAQHPKKVPRIGFLSATPYPLAVARVDAFKQGLRELGYIEGKNLVIEWRFSDGSSDRLLALAVELVALKVDIIVSGGAAVTRAAKKATTTIPIVMAADLDPVGSGHAASLAQPGGNITGLSLLSPELSGKQLELLKDTLPKLSLVAVLANSIEPGSTLTLKEIGFAAAALKLKLQQLDVFDPKDIETAIQSASKGRADAVLVLPSLVLNSRRAQTVEFMVKSRLPAIYFSADWIDDGGLMFYGASYPDLFRRSATYIDKILKGRTPAELPIEQPMKFELIINLKAAKQIGLTIPPEVLARANKVIR